MSKVKWMERGAYTTLDVQDIFAREQVERLRNLYGESEDADLLDLIFMCRNCVRVYEVGNKLTKLRGDAAVLVPEFKRLGGRERYGKTFRMCLYERNGKDMYYLEEL